MLEVREVDFDDIRKPWLAMEEAGELPTIFQTLGWMETWWQTFGELRKLRKLLLAAYQGSELVGIAPLYVDWTSLRGVKLRKVLRPMGYPESDYHDLIVRPGHEGGFIRGVLASLENMNWDIAVWSDWHHGSLGYDILIETISDQGFFLKPYRYTPCPYIHLPQSFGDYLKTINRRTYNNIFYYRRKLQRLDKVGIRTCSQPEEMEGGIEEFLRLHKSRWQAKGQSGALAGPALEDFHRRIVARLDRYARILLLTLGDRSISADYGFVYRGCFCSYLRGFDPEYAAYRVGNILILSAIEYAIAQGLRIYDFMRGDEGYKFLFARSLAYNQRIIFAKGWPELLLWRALNV